MKKTKQKKNKKQKTKAHREASVKKVLIESLLTNPSSHNPLLISRNRVINVHNRPVSFIIKLLTVAPLPLMAADLAGSARRKRTLSLINWMNFFFLSGQRRPAIRRYLGFEMASQL